MHETETRLRLLEAHVEVQEQVLAAIQAERIEAERLNDSVVRLGLGATSLGEALLQVDRNQQLLTKLGQEVQEVTASSATKATKEELAALHAKQRNELAAYRKKVVGRAYVAAVVVLAIFSGAGLLAANYASSRDRRSQQECQVSKKQIDAVRDYLEEVAKRGTNPIISQKAQTTVDAFPPVNCEAAR